MPEKRKTQDEINNERLLAQEESLRIQKEGLTEKEQLWSNEMKERDRKQFEILNQRKFFLGLHQGLKDGSISPKETLAYEEVSDKTPKEIEEMNDHDFSVWVERIQFARELSDTRQAIEEKKIASALIKKIETDREGDWIKKAETLTPTERAEFDRRFTNELNKLK